MTNALIIFVYVGAAVSGGAGAARGVSCHSPGLTTEARVSLQVLGTSLSAGTQHGSLCRYSAQVCMHSAGQVA